MNHGILVVDDTAFMRNMIKNILEKEGYKVVGEASTGDEAILKFKTLSPELVITDITMPGMNGIECLRQIKSHNNSAKVIICSAMGQQSIVIDAIENGANDFIVKPFIPDRVITSVKNVLNK